MYPHVVEESESDSGSSPQRIMSCRNRAKPRKPPTNLNRPHSFLIDIPASVSGQGFSVKNKHKASKSHEKGKGLAPPEVPEEETGINKKDLEKYYVPNPQRNFSGVGCEPGPSPSSESERRSWELLTLEDLPVRFPAGYTARGRILEDIGKHPADLTVPDLCRAQWLGMFPDHIQFRLASKEERACSLNDGWTAFSYAHIRAGLRYPLSPFLVLMLKTYEIAITQLVPNALLTILAFEGWCRHKNIIPDARLFQYCFNVTINSKDPGYVQLTCTGVVGKLFGGANTSNKKWKDQYFFIRSADPSRPLDVPNQWHTNLGNAYKKYNSNIETKDLQEKVKKLKEFSHSPGKKGLCQDRVLNLLAFTSPEILMYFKVFPFTLGSGQQAEIAEFLSDVLSYGTVRRESTGVKGRGPLLTHVGEDIIPLKLPTEKQTEPGSGHACSFSKLYRLILADYPSDKSKTRKKVAFDPQLALLAAPSSPSVIPETPLPEALPDQNQAPIPPVQAQTEPSLPSTQISKKRSGGPLEISRPLKQGSGKGPRVIAQLLGQGVGSELDAYLDTSMVSVRRPKKTPAPSKQTSDSVEIVEPPAGEVEVITLSHSEDAAPEEESTKNAEVPPPPEQAIPLVEPESHPSSSTSDTSEEDNDEEEDAAPSTTEDERFARELDAVFRLEWNEEEELRRIQSSAQTRNDERQRISQSFSAEQRQVAETMLRSRGSDVFFACQSQQNAYLTVAAERMDLLERRNSLLERHISMLTSFKETVQTARKEKFSARAHAKKLKKDLAASKVREDTLQEQLEAQVAQVSTFAATEKELELSRESLAIEQKARETAEAEVASLKASLEWSSGEAGCPEF